MDKSAYVLENECFAIHHEFRTKHIVINQYSKPLCPAFWVNAVYEPHSSGDEHHRALN